jgi:hypothetical protein
MTESPTAVTWPATGPPAAAAGGVVAGAIVVVGGAALAGTDFNTCEVDVEVGEAAVVVGALVVLEGGLVGVTVVELIFFPSEVVVVVRAVLWAFASGADEPHAARNTNGKVALARPSLTRWRFIWPALGRSELIFIMGSTIGRWFTDRAR